MTKLTAFWVAVLLSAVTVLSDYFVKRASLLDTLWNKWLLLGMLVSASTAVWWMYVMKTMKLSTIGIVYGVSCIVFLTVVSVFVFHEKFSVQEGIGILMGIGSIILLYKFS